MDSLYKKRFKHFELPNHKDFSFDSLKNPIASVPSGSPATLFLSHSMNISLAIVFIGISVSGLIYWNKTPGSSGKKEIEISSLGLELPGILNKNSITTATIFKNPISLSENKYLTKNTDSMKNLKAMALLLTAPTTLNSVPDAQTTDIPKSHTVEYPVSALNTSLTSDLILNSNSPLDSIPKAKMKGSSKDMSGTFYGEKLYWSAENNELYFEGKSIIAFDDNHFVSNGSASFLGKVYYLVIDGKPIKLNAKSKEDFKLSEKKYNLTRLSAEAATTKYGEDGKNGAIEISITE